MRLQLRIADYSPVMRENPYEQILAVDTRDRETILPDYFFEYFNNTFMIESYTCNYHYNT